MRLTFITLALLIASVCATAQPKTSFGVHAGLGLNKTTAPKAWGDYKLKYILGPTAGAMLKYRTCDMLDLQAELNYSLRGYKDDIYTIEEAKSTYKVRSSYLELPVLVKFYPMRQYPLNIQAGPQIGVLLGRGIAIDDDTLNKEWLKADDRRFDYGINFGIGYDEGKWSLDLRYYLGLQHTYKHGQGYQNRDLSITVGYYFNK